MSKSKVWVALLIGLLSAATSQAGSVSYFLDQSNRLADGVNYLLVTISDDGKEGTIDFTVEALQPLIDLAGDDFGIRMFGFNVVGGVGAEARNVSALPDNWRARNGGRMDGFGLFDITLQPRSRDYYYGRNRDNFGKGHEEHGNGKGIGHEEHGNGKGLGHVEGQNNPDQNNPKQQPLTFSITGVDFDDLLSYIDLSTGFAPEGFSLFSARVTGLILGDCDGGDKDGYSDSVKCDATSAYFGGTSAVPAPPALWLLGTGIAGLVVRRCRAARSAATA